MTEEEFYFIKTLVRYDPHTGNIHWIKNRPKGVIAGDVCKNKNRDGHIQVSISGKKYSAHRLAFLFMGEPLPEQVDHINGIPDDNRWCNLRPCCNYTNAYNQGKKKNNTSGYKGVFYDKGKWRARTSFKGCRINVGRFSSKEDAYKALCEKIKELHGEFANYG